MTLARGTSPAGTSHIYEAVAVLDKTDGALLSLFTPAATWTPRNTLGRSVGRQCSKAWRWRQGWRQGAGRSEPARPPRGPSPGQLWLCPLATYPVCLSVRQE